MKTLNYFSNNESQHQSIMSLYKTLDEKAKKSRTVIHSEDTFQSEVNKICRNILISISTYLTLGLISPCVGFKNALAVGTVAGMYFDAKHELGHREQKFLDQVNQLRSDISSRVFEDLIENRSPIAEYNSEDGVKLIIYKDVDWSLIDKRKQELFEKEVESINYPQLGFGHAVVDPAFWTGLLKSSTVGRAILISFGALVSQTGIYMYNWATTS